VSGVAAAPTLATARLTLAAHAPADHDDMAAMWSDPEVTRFIGGRPFARDEVWSRLLRYVGHWAALGFGYWAARETATGRFVGEVGFADFRRVLDPPLRGPEAGWIVAPWAHGKGYAREAMEAAMAWSLPRFGDALTTCIIAPENAPSLRLAARLGFAPVREALHHDKPVVVLERPPG
jgi:RimJ/RimL family protein N-acetyltransferase